MGISLLVGGWRLADPSVICAARPVPPGRRLLGLLCVLVFGLTFVPVPFGS